MSTDDGLRHIGILARSADGGRERCDSLRREGRTLARAAELPTPAAEPTFNTMDLTYRADLRELNELHYARFEAKLEQRLAELQADRHRWPADRAAWELANPP